MSHQPADPPGELPVPTNPQPTSRKPGRPRRFTDRTSTAIRFPTELHARLSQAADERDVPLNFLVNKAVEEFLDRLLPISEIRWTRETPVEPVVWGTGQPRGHQINKWALDDFLSLRSVTFGELARSAELDPVDLQAMVDGRRSATFSEARAIARALAVNPATLFPSTWTGD